MKLKDLKRRIGFLYARYENRTEYIDDLEVVITTCDPSLGGRAFSNVSSANRGFD